MSFDTHRNWFYQLHGKQIHLWQYSKSGNTDLVSGNFMAVNLYIQMKVLLMDLKLNTQQLMFHL